MKNLHREISDRYGFKDPDIKPLVEGNQALFSVRYSQDGQHKRAVLRHYYEWVDYKDIEAETNWLAALASETTLRVPYPIAATDGTFIQDIDLNSDPASRHAVLVAWLPGTELAENISQSLLWNLGRSLACLHNHSARTINRESAPSQRQAFEVWVDDWSVARDVAADAEDVLKTAGNIVTRMMQSISAGPDLCGFIHGDPHPWNIVVDGSEPAFIDYSDCGWGPYAFDIASALVYYKYPWVWDEEPSFDYPDIEQSLLAGYASERALPHNIVEALPVCFAARMLVLVQWLLDEHEGVDATAFSRRSITNSVDHLRRLCRDNL